MKKLLMFAACLGALPALAHPEHGHGADSGLAHLVAHQGPVLLACAAVVLGLLGWMLVVAVLRWTNLARRQRQDCAGADSAKRYEERKI